MALVERYEKDVKNIKQNILRIVWYMRGGVTYSEAMDMSIQEREIISKIIDENLETTKKINLPFF